jgi:teichuronic acid biosynthesis glycosyltransferase TuaG
MSKNDRKVAVSIIMPCYNSERFIGEAIRSVVNQSFNNWELLICDDGSTDNSVSIAKNYASRDSRISVIQNKNERGAPGARNSCLDIASGRYIAFLDADDLWLKNKLELQISFMKSNSYTFVYSYHQVIDEDDNFISDCMAPASVNSKLMRFSNFIPCLTAVYDSHSIGKVFQPNIVKRNDFALWLRILNHVDVERAHCLPVITARYRANAYGLSSNKKDALKYFYLCLKEFGGCNSFQAYFFSACYLFIVAFKKKFNFIYNFFVVKI